MVDFIFGIMLGTMAGLLLGYWIFGNSNCI